MTRMKKGIGLLLAVVLIVGLTLTAGADWTQFRGAADNNAVFAASTPKTQDETELLWSASLRQSWDTLFPLAAGGRLYAAVGGSLYELDTNGNLLQTTTLTMSAHYVPRMAYGAGRVYVPILDTATYAEGTVEAVAVDGSSSGWVVATRTNHQTSGAVTFHNGHIYFGTYEPGVGGATVAGSFACYDATDGSLVWEELNGGSGFNGSGAVVVGNRIIYGGDEGVLYSRDLTAPGATPDAYTPANVGAIRSSIVYNGGYLYFASTNGYIHRVTVNADGTFVAGSDVSAATTYANNTSAPVVYGGRVYVVSGWTDFADYKGEIAVYSAGLSPVTKQEVGYSQSSPLLTHDSAGNVNLYVALNRPDSALLCVSHAAGSSALTVSTLWDSVDYNMNSLILGDTGVLYYGNGGDLCALNLKPAGQTPAGSEWVTVWGGTDAQADTGKQNPGMGR